MNNIETKPYSFREGSSLAYSTLDAYHSFGWEESSRETNRVRSGRLHHNEITVILIRDKEIPHYDEIRNLENEYNYESKQIKRYEPASAGLAFFLLLLLLVPGIIYFAYKCTEKAKINNHNYEVSAKMAKCVEEAENIVNYVS